jgi:NADPH:quinone reductase-like Zn-dependent oxidoreductase
MAAATMKRWTTMMDGIDNFKLETVPVPDPAALKDDEVLVKISRVSLNNRDIKRTYSCPLNSSDFAPMTKAKRLLTN